jgi:hypothetical protein
VPSGRRNAGRSAVSLVVVMPVTFGHRHVGHLYAACVLPVRAPAAG